MKHFFSSLFGLAKQHPALFLLSIVLVVIVLGGIVWKGLSLVFGLIRKVPGGGAVANAAEGAVNKVAGATGSA
jgi:hypothetical protein